LNLLGESQESLTEFVCRLKLGTHVIMLPQTTQHRKKLVRSFQVFTKVLSTEVELFHFRSRDAFEGTQRYP
jgi:hypothetical protein